MGKTRAVCTTRWAFDTEDNSQGSVYWINFFDGSRHVSFDHPHRAIEWILDQAGEFWAVNLEYDMINLFSALMDKMCVLTYGGFGLLKATIYGKPVKFFNTLRHWPLSVEEMGVRLGYKKLPFDPTNLDYCKRDTEITWRFVGEMLKRYEDLGMDQVGATLPSTALKFYVKSFCPCRYERDESLEVWDRLARARYGGRCEVFHTWPVESPVHEYDINSSYPYAMKNEEFPDLDSINRNVKDPDWTKGGVACCTVISPDQEFPILPYKHPDSKKLLFPIGAFRGTWTYPELRFAMAHGYTIKAVHDAIEYEVQPSPFAAYIEFLYRKRLEVKGKDELMAYTLKIAMNSTFGKFGEEGDLQIISRGVRHSLSQVPRHSNMIWAAYILAYGRLQLYRCMRRASEKGTLLYVDTDSVFVRSKTRPFGDGSPALGQLAYKGTYHYAHFKLPKLYRINDHYKAKGVPMDRRAEKSEEERLKREFFYDGVAEFLKPYRWLESKKLHEQANVWHEVTKSCNAAYDKRELRERGATWPLTIT
jgi:hypothetical protein